jgi:hypothetical protein
VRDEQKKPRSTPRPLRQKILVVALAVLVLQPVARAHIGSPDVFLEAQAGPYRVFVTVRPPHAIPGVADVDILTTSDDVRDVRIVPLPLTGPGAQFAPVADRTARSAEDPRLFTGHLWMMGAGAWQVRVTIAGDRGDGTLSVPVPTLPQSTLAMSRALRATLVGLMLLLAAGFVGIISAMAREAALAPGEPLDRRARVRGRIAGGIAAVIVGAIVFLGNGWWSAEALNYDRYVYKPLTALASVTDEARLKLYLSDPGWIASRRLDDFVPDHGHRMHLFVVSPALDRLWHLHPAETATGIFDQPLPQMPVGDYELFADVVHATGVSETVTGRLRTIPMQGAPLSGDDSEWSETDARLTPDASDDTRVRLKADTTEARTGTATATATATPAVSGFSQSVKSSRTVDGGRIVWVRDETRLEPKKLTLFTFRVEDASGQPARDLELYMGMPGHAIFVRRDRKVFAHVHPSGSAPMAALQIAMPAGASHAAHDMDSRQFQSQSPSTVTFPYGFPEPGDYRIFVQVKRTGRVVTGVFDATVH